MMDEEKKAEKELEEKRIKKRKEKLSELKKLLNHTNIDDIGIEITKCTKFGDCFNFLKIIGFGAFGVVISAIERETGDYCAIKLLQKAKFPSKQIQSLKKESEILSKLDHQNIVKFKHVRESIDYFFIVMELIQGGSLKRLMHIKNKKNQVFSEQESSIVIQQILQGLSAIHSKNFMHRDLKPDNILFMNKNDLSTLKIVDLGLGAKFERSCTSVYDKCGTMIYMSPQQAINNKYTKAVDIWSCGILMFMMLTGKHPLFQASDTYDSYIKKLKNPVWQFPTNISELAIDLFSKLCKPDDSDRYTAQQALQHPWATRTQNAEIPLTTVQEMNFYFIGLKFKQIIRAIMFIGITKFQNLSFIQLDENYERMVKDQDYFKNHGFSEPKEEERSESEEPDMIMNPKNMGLVKHMSLLKPPIEQNRSLSSEGNSGSGKKRHFTSISGIEQSSPYYDRELENTGYLHQKIKSEHLKSPRTKMKKIPMVLTPAASTPPPGKMLKPSTTSHFMNKTSSFTSFPQLIKIKDNKHSSPVKKTIGVSLDNYTELTTKHHYHNKRRISTPHQSSSPKIDLKSLRKTETGKSPCSAKLDCSLKTYTPPSSSAPSDRSMKHRIPSTFKLIHSPDKHPQQHSQHTAHHKSIHLTEPVDIRNSFNFSHDKLMHFKNIQGKQILQNNRREKKLADRSVRIAGPAGSKPSQRNPKKRCSSFLPASSGAVHPFNSQRDYSAHLIKESKDSPVVRKIPKTKHVIF